MSIISSLDTAATALTAQRLRMDVIASNIANAGTTRTAAGGPYRRTRVVFTATQPSFSLTRRAAAATFTESGGRSAFLRQISPTESGVVVSAMVPDPSPPRLTYDPGHPDADAQGYVAYPNVDVTTEMADMLSATRAYEANVTVVNASKSMALKAIEIGRG